MAKPVVAVGCWDWGDATHSAPAHQKFDYAGNSYPHGNRIYLGYYHLRVFGIALLDDGSTILGSSLANYSATSINPTPYTLRKLNQDGDLIWGVNQGAPVTSIAVDSSGNIYTAGDPVSASGVAWGFNYENAHNLSSRTGYYTTRKYNSSGVLQWAMDHGMGTTYDYSQWMMPIAVANGYVYTGSQYNSTTGNLIKYDASTGSIVWGAEIDGNSSVSGIAVDVYDNVYVIGNLSNAYVLRKYNSSGTLVSSAPLEVRDNPSAPDKKYGRAVAIDSSGNIIVATDAYFDDWYAVGGPVGNFLYKYDSSCTLIAEQAKIANANLYTATGMALDADDRVYISRLNPSDSSYLNTVARFAADFSYDWGAQTLNAYETDSIDAYSIAVKETQTPALRIPLSIAASTYSGDRSAAAPAIPVGLAIGQVRIIRDYVGPPLPAVYKLELTGTPNLELPLKSFSCRRNQSGIFISAVSALPSIDTIDMIESRLDGDIVIYRGVKFRDGTTQIDEMVRAPLSTMRYDMGTENASVSFEASTEISDSGGSTRTINGISYRNEQSGLRRVRCEIDTFLRVGDTADLGAGETMIVDSITYTVSPSQGFMEISENE